MRHLYVGLLLAAWAVAAAGDLCDYAAHHLEHKADFTDCCCGVQGHKAFQHAVAKRTIPQITSAQVVSVPDRF